MAGFLPRPAKTKLLDDLCTGTTYLGLATSMPQVGEINMASVQPLEITTGGYARQSVTWSAASTTEPVQKVNSAAITAPAVTADMPPASFAFLTTSSSGTGGTLLYVWELAEPVGALSGKPWHVPAGALKIE